MTKKADFNADEWAKVVEGPLLAGMQVITTDRGGTIRESMAMGQVYAQARQQQGAGELLDELVATPPAMDPARMRSAGDAYKGFVRAVADAVAHAHKEGGFLGVGGKEVSPEEQAALDEIEATLS